METGRLLAGREGSPDFRIGIILAIFIKGGKLPELSEMLHKCVRSGVIMGSIAFMMNIGKSS